MALLQDFKECLLHPWKQKMGLETHSSWKAGVPLSLKAFQPASSQQEQRAAFSCCSSPATRKPDQCYLGGACARHFSNTDLGPVGILSPTTARGQQIFGASAPSAYQRVWISLSVWTVSSLFCENPIQSTGTLPSSGLSGQQHIKAPVGPANYHPRTDTSELIATARGKEEAKGLAFKVATSFRTSDRWLALQDALSVRQIKN